MKKRILLTNDDGFEAPGLQALAQRMRRLGEVWVVAPRLEASASSHGVNLVSPVWVEAKGEREFTVTGSPTDCVFLALGQILPGPPDVILSGINRGGNLAVDVTYSGTVGAAMEGAIRGIPSISISRDSFEAGDYGPAADIGAHVAEQLLEHGLPDGVLLNVNVPALPAEEILGVKAAPLGHRRYPGTIDERRDPRGRPYWWIAGANAKDRDIPGTDCVEVHAGYATVTPITVDWTHRASLEALGDWELAPR
jgi:5'-nucleotidase